MVKGELLVYHVANNRYSWRLTLSGGWYETRPKIPGRFPPPMNTYAGSGNAQRAAQRYARRAGIDIVRCRVNDK